MCGERGGSNDFQKGAKWKLAGEFVATDANLS